ncbi:MAG TPA: EAL domain-containing protein [Gammaproteobacteria bacterium]|nr:EAL domain-containing protein [Gammaproteobacteria bacterium]
MKIKTKVLIATGLACILSLGFSGFFINSHPLLALVVILLFFIGVSAFFYHHIIRRIEFLNKQLHRVNANPREDIFLTIVGTDELADISEEINKAFDNHHLTRNEIKQQLKQSSDRQQITVHIDTSPSGKIAGLLPEVDPLTELPNRTLFNDALNKSISHAKRHGTLCAVLLVEMDAFKNIAVTLGSDIGNHLLNEMSKRLTGALRKEDLVAHLEGEEFIVLLNDIEKPKFASIVAEKILKTCAQPINDFFLTASIGISIFPADGTSLEDILKNADIALFRAKQDGGNTYRFHTDNMDLEAREFIRLEHDLRHAIEQNELVLYYQPKLNIKKGSITGVEALLRWAHPELGLLNPVQFISVAEDTGLMMTIGEWALREACKTNKYWQDEGYEHFAVSLNLSPKQFEHPNIAETIKTVLNETGLNPNYLELEISEATVMHHVDVAKNRLDAIRETGVELSIDHFGAGYTSISHLKQFPVSAIKIDQNYIKGVPNNPDDCAITNAFIGLAHHLGLEVVAEGVETGEQVEYLAAQNCDMVQGYFLSHPLPADKIVLQFKKLMDRALF